MKKIILYILISASVFGSNNLQWQEKNSDLLLTFDEAVEYCQDLNLYSKQDWRLATLVELSDLSKNIDFIESDKQYYIWTSTVYRHFYKAAWFVSFSDYYQHFSIKTNKLHVKCVREVSTLKTNKFH